MKPRFIEVSFKTAINVQWETIVTFINNCDSLRKIRLIFSFPDRLIRALQFLQERFSEDWILIVGIELSISMERRKPINSDE